MSEAEAYMYLLCIHSIGSELVSNGVGAVLKLSIVKLLSNLCRLCVESVSNVSNLKFV